jgi:hypothetical protein
MEGGGMDADKTTEKIVGVFFSSIISFFEYLTVKSAQLEEVDA